MPQRGVSAERIAKGILEEKGFKIIDVNPQIIVHGVEIGELDLIVKDDNNQYLRRVI